MRQCLIVLALLAVAAGPVKKTVQTDASAASPPQSEVLIEESSGTNLTAFAVAGITLLGAFVLFGLYLVEQFRSSRSPGAIASPPAPPQGAGEGPGAAPTNGVSEPEAAATAPTAQNRR